MIGDIEGDLVYPLIRGRSVARWAFSLAGHTLVVQDPKTQRGYAEDWLQETHPLTWKYLKRFEGLLRSRKAFQKFFDPDKDPFYSMYAIAEYTFAPHKVVWMDVSATMKAVVVSSKAGTEMPLPEHKLMLLATKTQNEAHYVAAVLNSHPFDTVVSGYIVDNSVSTHPIENLVIPQFNPKNATHAKLAGLSRNAHQAVANPANAPGRARTPMTTASLTIRTQTGSGASGGHGSHVTAAPAQSQNRPSHRRR